MNKLLKKLMMKIGVKALTSWIRGIAEGDQGPFLRDVYWKIAGAKRVTSVMLAALAVGLVGAGYAEAGAWVGAVATIGLSLGFVDARWRDTWQADTFRDSTLWRLLSNNAPVLTVVFGSASAWLDSGECTLGAWCARGVMATAVVAAAMVQIGLVDSAWKARPPLTPLP